MITFFSLAAIVYTISKQSAVKRMLYNYNTTNLNDLKEVFPRVSWDIVDFDADDIELPWSQWKNLFFLAVNYVVPLETGHYP